MCFTNTSLLSKRLAHCEIGSAAILFAPAYGMAVELFPNNTLEPLDFGIGIHFGQVAVFKFKDFKGEESNTGFLGSAVNIASRVEQQTKDHPYQLLCTKKFRDAVLNATTKAKNWFFRFYNG